MLQLNGYTRKIQLGAVIPTEEEPCFYLFPTQTHTLADIPDQTLEQ